MRNFQTQDLSMKTAIRRKGFVLLLGAAVALPLIAQTDFSTDEKKAGYSIGANIGFNLASQGLAEDIDHNALVDGIRDGLTGQLQMTEEEIVEVLQAFAAEQQVKAQAAIRQLAQEGVNFLAENTTRAGVITTASGLQYEVIEESADALAARPTESDSVSVHYHGYLINGAVFDSSVDRGEPISFTVNGVIPGWTEGLQLMKVGDKFRFFVPSELGYGENEIGPIPPNSVLVFEVELLAIE
jgi:FKBP-type peptidyl-prolyl cis-trans isomerase